MRLAVASGKGGTGKTLLSTNLAWMLAREGHAVTYLDCDVEAPNGHLYLKPAWLNSRRLSVPVPTLRQPTCSGCGACQEACAFNAMITLPDRVLLFPELCHGCGACLLACPEEALVEGQREIGALRRGRAGDLDFRDGLLDIGEAKAPPLIEGLLQEVPPRAGRSGGLVIMDAPPGTSCSAVTVARHADLVLLVTEPTPFGLNDFRLAMEMCGAVGRPVIAVINRADLGDGEVRRWIQGKGVPLAAEIPYSREVAAAYASGKLAAREALSFLPALARVAASVLEAAA